jgi:hypothetical protein
MTRPTDEILMYYADGLLEPSERQSIEKLLAEDPELRARLQVFLLTGRSLGAQLLEDEDASTPAMLPVSCPPAMSSRPFHAKPRFNRAPGFRTAMAASVALAVLTALLAGLGLGWALRGDGAGTAIVLADFIGVEDNRVIAKGALQRALDSLPAGGRITVGLSQGKEIRLQIKMTFRNAAGNYCREYEIVRDTPERYAGVACHAGGRWSVALQALTAPSSPAANRTAPAGSGSPAMDAAVGALIEGDPLTREDEAAIMRKGWQE